MLRNLFAIVSLFLTITGSFFTVYSQEAPTGSPGKMSPKEEKARQELKGLIKGTVVWSTSRANSKHDIWIMQADGSGQKALTKSANNVDWYPRFSHDGRKVLFTRSKSGWVPESDAGYYDKWDLWEIGIDGTDEKLVVENACWGTYLASTNDIIFARGEKVFQKTVKSDEEKCIFDGNENIKKGTIAQQPELSPDGKYLVATLRGSSRETGIWDLEKKVWNTTGGGCQTGWFPSGDEIYRVNSTGNGGTAAPSEIFAMKIADGKPIEKITRIKLFRMMDLPGRRSHEYFPKFDSKGQWMVWCATDKGHDHDIYDYEIYIWKRGNDVKSAVRLTFHTGNDRWPGIYLTD